MAILEWQNLIFLLPMLAAILYILMMTLGVVWGGGTDLDAGHDVHLDVGHDVSADAGHDLGGEHHVEAGHGDHGVQGGHFGFLERVFSLLGVGKVPLSILGLSVCFIWGAGGLVLNFFRGVDTLPQNMALAALGALVGARSIAEGLACLLPREETYHTPRAELVGEVGEVLYEVTSTSGTVRLSDPSGNLLDLDCRVRDGARIQAGARVVLGEYEPGADVFFVDPIAVATKLEAGEPG